jgi:hypothetical protein
VVKRVQRWIQSGQAVGVDGADCRLQLGWTGDLAGDSIAEDLKCRIEVCTLKSTDAR